MSENDTMPTRIRLEVARDNLRRVSQDLSEDYPDVAELIDEVYTDTEAIAEILSAVDGEDSRWGGDVREEVAIE